MKVKGRKHIALVTLISMLIASFIPAQSFALEESEPEVFIVVKEMDEEEESEIIAEEEESEKEEEQETVIIEEEETEDNSLSVAEAEAKEEEKTDSETVVGEENTEPEKASGTETTEEKDEADTDLLKEAEFANTINDYALRLFLQSNDADMHNHDGIDFTEWTVTNSLPSVAGNYYLANDVTISSTWNVPQGTTNLCLNGHGITRTNASGTTGSVIQVGAGATLNLYDCGTEKRYYTIANPTANGAGLGTVVDKNTYDAAGENARGTFIGGYITGGNITGGADANHLIGGGVNVDKGSFTMNGGTIIGNKVCINAGGVKVKGAGASFTMNGGAILANYNDCYGGAVSVGDNGSNRLCTVIVNGGTIARNWSGRNGGAFHTDGYGHTFLFNGGSVFNNYTNGYYDNGSNGRSGGGFIKAGATLKVSGNTVFKDNYNGGNVQNNIHFATNNSDLLDLSGHLDSDAEVGVYARGLSNSSDIKVATGAWKEDSRHLNFDISGEGSLVYCDGVKDWIYLNEELVEFTGAHHSHTAGTVWATAYVVPTHNHDDIGFSDWTATDSLPTTAGNYCLINDVTISSTWNVPQGTTNLCLNGHGIKMTGSGSVISVGNGVALTIFDEEANKGKITGGSVTTGGGAVTVDAGSFVLNGGIITGNKTTGTSRGTSAGAIYLKNSATFLMNGGEISGNTSETQGGAICTDETAVAVDIAGGEIKNNTSKAWGSAIWAGRTTNAKLIIRGDAKIIDNISNEGAGTVNVAGTHNYILSGDPEIFGKSTTGSGKDTHLNLDGNNSELYQKVELSGPLTNDTGIPKITICAIRNTLSSGVTYIFTQNWNTYMGSADPAKYFKVDSSITGVRVVRKNGEAALASSGDMYIFFDANGGTGAMDSQLVPSGTATLNGNTFARDNYHFVGWNTKADGSGTGYEDKGNVTLSGDLTLYAQWEKNTFDGNGTEEKPYLIQTADDWNALSEHINSGGTQYSGAYFKLTDDISVSKVLGTRPDNSTDSNDYVFCGTFDGDGHTLNVNISNSGFAAPFAVAHNATIKNLHVTGKVTSTGNHATGLVAASKGKSIYDASTLKIQNVRVSVDISCNSHIAGIVGHAHAANIIMENVVFDGSLSASSVQGGFIGWGGITGGTKYGASFKDCIFAGTYRNGVAFYPVAFASGQGTATLQNDFYTTSLGSGGSPIANTGNGQVKLFVATVEKDGAVKCYETFEAAVNAWTDGSTLKLMTDVSFDSRIDLPAGKRILDLNGKTLNELSNAGLRIGQGASAVCDLTIIDTVGSGKIRHDGSRAGSMMWVKEGSSLTLNGGTLEADTTASPVIDFFQQKNASFTMNGGKITGYANNGAVRFGAGCAFTMTGGEISGLQTSTGVFDYSFDSGSVIKISGNPVVQNNTVNTKVTNFNLPSGKVINIDGALTDGASIGITLQSGTGIFTSGLSGKGTENNFISDNSNYTVALKDGEACLINKTLDVTAIGYEGSYDGNAHSITVSAPEGATVKYGIEEGAYTLDDCPSYTDAGTYTVYYEVSKTSYISSTGSATVKINKIDSVITTAPKTKGILNENGSEQELIDEGTVTGGTFYYAIGDDESSPDDTEYKTEMPKASDAGYYYIWYKVKGDANHNDIAPAYVKTTLAGEDWVTVSGAVYDSANIPVGNATVKLMQGNKTVDKMRSDSDGGYYFAVPAGLYNIVIKTDDATITNMLDVSENITKDIDVSDSCTESLLDVVNSDKSIVVGGLNEEAYAIRAGDSVSADKSVAVKLTVKSISEDGTEGAKKIAEDEADKNLEFFDIKVEKNVDSTVTELTETQNILEFAIPCPYTNKKGLVAYHYHGSEVLTLTQISSKAEKADGTFYVDKEKKMMYVYLSRFSTIAMGYTPYYRVKSNISLGDFTGNVSVTLAKVGSSEKYELNDVSPDDISFQDIPKGEYTMTIKWEDGAVNTLPSVSISIK